MEQATVAHQQMRQLRQSHRSRQSSRVRGSVSRRRADVRQTHRVADDGEGKYIQHIYGEHEIGGTSMMYLAATPFEQLGFPALPENPPAEVNAAVMHATPTIAAGMILALSGMYWLIKRRDRLEP